MTAGAPGRPLVGILGGGQLGRMLALAGHPLGVGCLVVEPGDDPPAAPVAEVRRAAYDDPAALAELARRCDVVTVELEGVPVDALAWLAERMPVHPSPEAVAVAQDRLAEKQAFAALGARTARFATDPADAVAFAGAIVKTRRGGYDGRGQARVDDKDDLPAVWATFAADGAIIEEIVPFTTEVSLVAARGAAGEVVAYPLVENTHAGGILRRTVAPWPAVTPALQSEAEAIARRFLERYAYVGVVGIELFVAGDHLVVNEVAPRVHNTGHWTIEGAVTSQFEQHLRAILGWPLGSPAPIGTSVMTNLIGDLPDPAAVLGEPGAHLHLYGKAPRPGRKIGHVTVVHPEGLTPA